MELIYNAIWIFNNILVSTLIILIVHFLLEYLKENYDIDLFETHINKRNITDMDTLQHQDNVQHMNTNTVQCQGNAQNMDYELSKLINENIDDVKKEDNINLNANMNANMNMNMNMNANENILDNNSFTNIDSLTPII